MNEASHTPGDRQLTSAVSMLSVGQRYGCSMKILSLALLCFAATTLALSNPSMAESIGHDEARRMVEQGKIRPLNEIVDIVAAKVPGRLLETKLEHDDDGIVYDFKVLRDGGRVQEVEVEASTGKILSIEDDD